jgi:hypothetical protein
MCSDFSNQSTVFALQVNPSYSRPSASLPPGFFSFSVWPASRTSWNSPLIYAPCFRHFLWFPITTSSQSPIACRLFAFFYGATTITRSLPSQPFVPYFGTSFPLSHTFPSLKLTQLELFLLPVNPLFSTTHQFLPVNLFYCLFIPRTFWLQNFPIKFCGHKDLVSCFIHAFRLRPSGKSEIYLNLT